STSPRISPVLVGSEVVTGTCGAKVGSNDQCSRADRALCRTYGRTIHGSPSVEALGKWMIFLLVIALAPVRISAQQDTTYVKDYSRRITYRTYLSHKFNSLQVHATGAGDDLR